MIVHNREQNMRIVSTVWHPHACESSTHNCNTCTAQNKLFADNLEDKPILPQVDYNYGHSASIDLFRKSLTPI